VFQLGWEAGLRFTWGFPKEAEKAVRSESGTDTLTEKLSVHSSWTTDSFETPTSN
jgi:hypothetical protein